MHYYQFNIGDYRRRTAYLTPLEHGIYRILLDTYYLEEKPLCVNDATLMRTHNIRTPDEQEAFKNVINDFFELKEDGYHHAACNKEIAKYKEKSAKAAASAKARWDKKADAMRTHSEGNANHKPITNNHKPITKKKGGFAPPSLQEVSEYIHDKNYQVDAEQFINFYESKGWMVGKNKMKSWKACISTWQKRNEDKKNGNQQQTSKAKQHFDKLTEIARNS